jgi:adenylate cyclase
MTAAGFLGLHALATPRVLLPATNAGFALAAPVGLAAGAVFAALSVSPPRVASSPDGTGGAVSVGRTLRFAALAAMASWALVSLVELPPFDGEASAPDGASGALVALVVPAAGLYAWAALRFVGLSRRRQSRMLLGMAAAFVLLAEASLAVAFAPGWYASWWQWHALMLVASGLVAWSAHRQWHEERFADLYLDDTVAGARDMSVLCADLAGFTSFSERHPARDVAAMLDAYFEVAIPAVVRRYGGDIEGIAGDAVMVTFNRRGDQPDHPHRAAAAAFALQRETAHVADDHVDWLRFRIGVNTGQVSVAVHGTEGGRTHTLVGETVDLAARLEGTAPPGGVALGAETAARLAGARLERLAPLELKGRSAPLEAYLLLGLAGEDPA